jgi:AcrR family transcriptional regulator
MPEHSTGPAGRQDRRKARTREALIRSAQGFLARPDWAQASIKDITDAADLGFGSFYNHFTSKQELFDVALADVQERYGALLDDQVAGIDDIAEVFAACVRLTGRMVRTHPQIIGIITHTGMSLTTSSTGLAPRALRDIRRGIEAKRFTVDKPLVALATAGGSLLALIHLTQAIPGQIHDEDYDELASQLLRMLGVPQASARVIARRPLPAMDALSPPWPNSAMS